MTPLERLYGVPGAEPLWATPEDACRAQMPSGADRGEPWVIEEWSVRPPSYHQPDAEVVLENVVDWTGDMGEIDEAAGEQWVAASKDPEVVAAMQHVLDVMASKVSYRMADRLLRVLVVTLDERGEPLINGEPLHAPKEQPVVDLMAALEASVQAAKGARKRHPRSRDAADG